MPKIQESEITCDFLREVRDETYTIAFDSANDYGGGYCSKPTLQGTAQCSYGSCIKRLTVNFSGAPQETIPNPYKNGAKIPEDEPDTLTAYDTSRMGSEFLVSTEACMFDEM